jgi:hypothetical protein
VCSKVLRTDSNQKVIPDTKTKFVEQWRRDIFTYTYLRRGWARIEELGEGEKWTKDARTEKQWSDVMRRMNLWQKKWEEEQGIFLRDEMG